MDQGGTPVVYKKVLHFKAVTHHQRTSLALAAFWDKKLLLKTLQRLQLTANQHLYVGNNLSTSAGIISIRLSKT